MPQINTASWANPPKYIKPIIDTAFNQFGGAQGQFPSLSELPSTIPTLNVPNLTPEQMQVVQQMLATSGGGTQAPDYGSAEQQLAALTAGPIGSSPLTQQAMQAWQQNVAPTIEQYAALQGNASGGAALEALQQGQTSALVPLLQSEIQNRQTAANQYAALGQQRVQDQLQQMTMALEAAGLPREVALEQAQAAQDAAQQRFQFETGIQTMPLELMQSLIGQNTRTGETMTGMDWIGAIGKGLSPSGLLGSLGLGGGGGGGGGQTAGGLFG